MNVLAVKSTLLAVPLCCRMGTKGMLTRLGQSMLVARTTLVPACALATTLTNTPVASVTPEHEAARVAEVASTGTSRSTNELASVREPMAPLSRMRAVSSTVSEARIRTPVATSTPLLSNVPTICT